MMFEIHKVTIARNTEEPPQMYTYNTSVFVQDIKAERKRIKDQFQADTVFFVYTQMPKDEVPNK